jgi:hypothetical protein
VKSSSKPPTKTHDVKKKRVAWQPTSTRRRHEESVSLQAFLLLRDTKVRVKSSSGRIKGQRQAVQTEIKNEHHGQLAKQFYAQKLSALNSLPPALILSPPLPSHPLCSSFTTSRSLYKHADPPPRIQRRQRRRDLETRRRFDAIVVDQVTHDGRRRVLFQRQEGCGLRVP